MSSAPRYQPRYTVDDYRMWEGDWELWEGAPVALTPSPFGPHSRLMAQLSHELIKAVELSHCDVTVLVEIDWIVSENTVLRPDLTVICGRAPDQHVQETPALVVEILSASSRERDLVYKRQMYAENGVPFYVIVDPNESQISVLKLTSASIYHPIESAGELNLSICDDCALTIDVSRLFV